MLVEDPGGKGLHWNQVAVMIITDQTVLLLIDQPGRSASPMNRIIDYSPRPLFAWLLLFLVASPLPADEGKSRFDNEVARILAARCLNCHHGEEAKAELDLQHRETVFKGGENGSAVVGGKPQESLLWQRISADEMPPEDPLSEKEKAILLGWIQDGAEWGTDPIDLFRFTSNARAGYDWWSLQPLADPEPPASRGRRIRNPIDAFVLARLRDNKLGFSSDADPQSLIRRVYLDFLGLPPTPEEVDQFVQEFSEQSYQELVDRVLDSPHYGERWGRHWLDVVRFGESNGFERNNPRKDFWHYRDWVIKSLNEDMPYDQFVRLQIAGDIIKPNSYEGAASVGFLVAAVHNTVVGGSERMKRQSRADEIEELVAAVGQTFVGLTINCARCHDHKFDPIRQEEYYQLSAVVAGLNHGTRKLNRPEFQAQAQEKQQQLKAVVAKLQVIREGARKEILKKRADGDTPPPPRPVAMARWEFDEDFKDSIGQLHGSPQGGAKLAQGALVLDGKGSYVMTSPLTQNIEEKTLAALVQLDKRDQRGGGAITLENSSGVVFDSIVFGEREPFRWMAGSNGFVRTESFQGPEEAEVSKRPVHFAIVYRKDGTITGYRDGQPYGTAYKTGFQGYSAGDANLLFGLRHLPPGGNRFLSGRILHAELFNRVLNDEEVASIAGDLKNFVAEKEIQAFLAEDLRQQYLELKNSQQQLTTAIQQLEQQAQLPVYTNVAASPAETHFLQRGDVMKRGPLMGPAMVSAVSQLDGDLGLELNSSDADRRLKLAEWIVAPENSLTARVIVNRLWHYHFGVGIVDTPSDLGFNGGRPSHPALLDWLASRLIREQYRLKAIHRLIALSTTYRQSSVFRPAAARIDAGNRLLWRKSPFRVEGEVVRDSILAASGQLDLTAGGPGFEDVAITPNNGTTYYLPFDKEDPTLNRRTVYRFSPRGERMALLDTFDCPDPSAAAPRRSVTTTPLQALSLLNNGFVIRMANHMAKRVAADVGEDRGRQVDRCFQLALSRLPDKEERVEAIQLVEQHGLARLARVLFNTNEFLISP